MASTGNAFTGHSTPAETTGRTCPIPTVRQSARLVGGVPNIAATAGRGIA